MKKCDERWINESKRIILDTFKAQYTPLSTETINHSDNDDDELSIYLYKHQHIEKQNELEVYLNAPAAHHKTDILQWWKV